MSTVRCSGLDAIKVPGTVCKDRAFLLERVTGVEPVLSDWQPDVMPLYDTRLTKLLAVRF